MYFSDHVVLSCECTVILACIVFACRQLLVFVVCRGLNFTDLLQGWKCLLRANSTFLYWMQVDPSLYFLAKWNVVRFCRKIW